MKEKKEPTEYLAKTFFGLEEVLAKELIAIGAEDVKIQNRAVAFSGDLELMYKANYCLRTALNVLMPIYKFQIKNEKDLYLIAKEFNWTAFMGIDTTFAIDSVVGSDFYKHPHYASLQVKDAIADFFRDLTGMRPSVNVENPDLQINLHISNDQCTLSLNSSGESLHKRGYRSETNKAPLNEVLAAGMIALSGWNMDCDFVDPMCGSGTILIEAARMAYNIPSGILKKEFGFQKWLGYDARLFEKVKEEAHAAMTSFEYSIYGSDIQPKCNRISTENVENANLTDKIKLFTGDFANLVPKSLKGLLLFNPPYGERLDEPDLELLYSQIGSTLKHNWKGYTAWFISSNPESFKCVGLRPTRKIQLFNGALECRFQKYDLYDGSKKASKQPIVKE